MEAAGKIARERDYDHIAFMRLLLRMADMGDLFTSREHQFIESLSKYAVRRRNKAFKGDLAVFMTDAQDRWFGTLHQRYETRLQSFPAPDQPATFAPSTKGLDVVFDPFNQAAPTDLSSAGIELAVLNTDAMDEIQKVRIVLRTVAGPTLQFVLGRRDYSATEELSSRNIGSITFETAVAPDLVEATARTRGFTVRQGMALAHWGLDGQEGMLNVRSAIAFVAAILEAAG